MTDDGGRGSDARSDVEAHVVHPPVVERRRSRRRPIGRATQLANAATFLEPKTTRSVVLGSRKGRLSA